MVGTAHNSPMVSGATDWYAWTDRVMWSSSRLLSVCAMRVNARA